MQFIVKLYDPSLSLAAKLDVFDRVYVITSGLAQLDDFITQAIGQHLRLLW